MAEYDPGRRRRAARVPGRGSAAIDAVLDAELPPAPASPPSRRTSPVPPAEPPRTAPATPPPRHSTPAAPADRFGCLGSLLAPLLGRR